MTWDVTVNDTVAEAYLSATSSSAGSAAEAPAYRKGLEYQSLASTHTFITRAFETFRADNSKGVTFFTRLVTHEVNIIIIWVQVMD